MPLALACGFLALASSASAQDKPPTAKTAEAKITLPPQQDLAIVGAKIELGDGTTIAKGVVLIKAGVIVAVTPGEEVPSGYTTYKADGLTLYPGFIDGFTPDGLKNQPVWTDDSKPSTTTGAPPTMWIGNRKGISPDWGAADNLDLKPEDGLYKVGFTNALIAPNRGSIRGAAAFLDYLAGGDRVLAPSVALSMSFRNGNGAGYPSNILGVIALMRQTLADAKSQSEGADLVGKVDKKPGWAKSLDALQPVVTGKLPVFFEVNVEREIGRAFRLSDEFGFKLVIVGGRDAYKLIPKLLETKTPVVYNVDIGDEPALTGTGSEAASTPDAVRKERNERWQELSHGAEQLIKAGVPVSFGSIGSADDYLKNVRKLISRGLDRTAALKAMTQSPANLFGFGDKLGSIAVGKKANLVLMSGDFADEKSEVSKVFVDGRSVFEKKAVTK